MANASGSHGFRLIASKDRIEQPGDFDFEKWNSFSRIVASFPFVGTPALWGASPFTPRDLRVEQRYLDIDGDAATTMPRFSGDPAQLDFLRYDITTLAYSIRNRGRAAIIGVGGGRDVLSAYAFGFRDITGVELNPIFIDLLTDPGRYRRFAGVADLTN